jgi:phospho-N-acetylmuramoyl-pentapeptide-transferase
LLGQAVLTLIALVLFINDPVLGEHIKALWIPFLKDPVWMVMPFPVLFGFYFLILAGSSNAINLTDGVDGLAIGCTLTVAMAYGIIAYATGHMKISAYLFLPYMSGAGELTVVCAVLCSACLAFLWFNAHPAEVFMGDTGSLALGGLVGTVAFLTLQPFTLVIIGGVFVFEAVSVILQVASFKSTGRRVFRMAPVHHHFELGGWAETQVVIRFWILSLICAVAGLATLKLR